MEWKSVIYEYMSRLTRCVAEDEQPHHLEMIADPQFKQIELERLHRVKQCNQMRGVRSLGAEIRLQLRNEEESEQRHEQRVRVELMLKRTGSYSIRGRVHVEEKIEHLYFTLVQPFGDEWVIMQIEPVIPEKRTIEDDPAVVLSINNMARRLVRPMPYLNAEIFDQGHSFAFARTATYQRDAVKAYADKHWNDPNPQFLHFAVDCTNYVSQCLYAGGAPMDYTEMRNSGWWYRGKQGTQEGWSYSWSVANAFCQYLSSPRRDGLRADTVTAPSELTIGDVICYDFNGDGRFQHSTIVTGADGAGMPLVNAHTTDCKARYWDYRDSYAWTERTVYRFLRIKDRF
jgi:hypothetical protein